MIRALKRVRDWASSPQRHEAANAVPHPRPAPRSLTLIKDDFFLALAPLQKLQGLLQLLLLFRQPSVQSGDLCLHFSGLQRKGVREMNKYKTFYHTGKN